LKIAILAIVLNSHAIRPLHRVGEVAALGFLYFLTIHHLGADWDLTDSALAAGAGDDEWIKRCVWRSFR
jgi:hypothetical protein